VRERLGGIRKSEERGSFDEKCWPQVAEAHAVEHQADTKT